MIESLGRLSRPALIGIGLVLVVLLGLADYEMGWELHLSLFYLTPIAVVSWFAGRRAGLLLSFLCALTWIVTDLAAGHVYRNLAIAAWNGSMQLGFFLVVCVMLSALRSRLLREAASARMDPLTRVANRRAFFELAEAEVQRMARYGGRFTVAYMDLDNFKVVNNRDGHETGDQVLLLVAEAIRKGLRANDVVARLGGDEFVILLLETGAEETETVFRKLRARLGDLMRRGGWPITLSAGAVTFEKPPESVEQMVRLADELMYSVKTSGKDRLEKRIIGR